MFNLVWKEVITDSGIQKKGATFLSLYSYLHLLMTDLIRKSEVNMERILQHWILQLLLWD
jgi:hypothetical protein